MADNVAITAGAGTTIAADEVGSAYYQRVKIALGADGEAADLDSGQQTMANSVPVVVASNQSAIPVSDNSTTLSVDDGGSTISIDDGNGAITVDGTVAVTNADITTVAGAVSGGHMQADIVGALPGGDNNIGNVDIVSLPAGNVGQQNMAGSLSVVVASNQSAIPVADGGGTLTVDGTVAVTNADLATIAGAVSATHMQADIVGALPAGTNYIGQAGPGATSVAFTLSCTAEAHHAGDVLAATQEIAGCLRVNAGTAELVSLVVLDEDDNTAAAMTLYFFNADATLGTEGSAISISDADARKLIGAVTIPASAWLDLIGSKVAVMPNIGLLLKGAGASTSLWMAASTAGTPTPTTSGITGHLTFIQY